MFAVNCSSMVGTGFRFASAAPSVPLVAGASLVVEVIV